MKKVTNRKLLTEPNATIYDRYILNTNSFPHSMDSVISFVVRIRFAAILTTIC